MQLIDIDSSAPANAPTPARPGPDDSACTADGPLLAPFQVEAPSPLTSALREHARLLRRRLGERPNVAAQQAAEMLAKRVVASVMETMDVVNAELGDVIRVGLLLSSARPGLKRMCFVLTDRLDAKRRLECSLTTSPRREDLILWADSLGRVVEIVRVGRLEADAADRLRRAVEAFLLETAGHFANGAGGRRHVGA